MCDVDCDGAFDLQLLLMLMWFDLIHCCVDVVCCAVLFVVVLLSCVLTCYMVCVCWFVVCGVVWVGG